MTIEQELARALKLKDPLDRLEALHLTVLPQVAALRERIIAERAKAAAETFEVTPSHVPIAQRLGVSTAASFQWVQAGRGNPVAETVYSFTCEECSEEATSRDPEAKFCSRTCANRATSRGRPKKAG